MPPFPANVCPLCGYDDCETVEKYSAVVKRTADRSLSASTQSFDQSQQIQAAAKILAESKSTLICGLECLELNAQMAAWRLADQLRAVVDSSLTNRSHAAMRSTQEHGKVSASYGEISNRSDLLVFWDCDLTAKHACLLKLFSSDRVHNRKIVFVGSLDSPMAKIADIVFSMSFVQSRNSFVQLICRLRGMVSGRSLLNDKFSDWDLPQSKVQQLFDLLKAASYGSLFFTSHDANWEFDFETESLMQLVSEFNSIRPLVGVQLRDDANGLGAETIMSLASGFPLAISLQRGLAESSGKLYSAAEVLRRSACDTILLCGNTDTDILQPIPRSLRSKLQQTTVIQLAPRSESFTDFFIGIPTLEFGKPFAGSVFRGDGALLSSFVPDARLSAVTVLNSLANAFQNVSN